MECFSRATPQSFVSLKVGSIVMFSSCLIWDQLVFVSRRRRETSGDGIMMQNSAAEREANVMK